MKTFLISIELLHAKQLWLSLVLAFSTCFVFGQSSDGDWCVGGGGSYMYSCSQWPVRIGTSHAPVAVLSVRGLTSGSVNNNRVFEGFRATNERMFEVNTASDHPLLRIYDRNGSTVDVLIATNGDSYFNGGQVGIGRTSASYDLDVDGTIRTNTLRYTTLIQTSDLRYKDKVATLESSLNKLVDLRGTSYFMKEETSREEENSTNKKHLGLIAQEVQEVFPELVYSDEEGYLGVDYISLIPVIVESIKDLHRKNLELEAETTLLHEKLASLTVDNDLKDLNKPRLLQNYPNPHDGVTTIRYFLPSEAQNSSISIFNMSGKLVDKYDQLGTGNNELTLTRKLSPGIYYYSISSEGSEIETKRMIVEE